MKIKNLTNIGYIFGTKSGPLFEFRYSNILIIIFPFSRQQANSISRMYSVVTLFARIILISYYG